MPLPNPHAFIRAATRGSRTTDADLLTRFAADRDEEAFAELVRRHGPLVDGAARRVAGDPDAAGDTFQAVFLLLARKAGAGGWGTTVGPWLYRVACRLAAKARRRAGRRRTVSLPVDALAPPADPASDLVWADVRSALDHALAGLPRRLRDPLVLCYLEGLTRDEAAAALGCSPIALKGRVARGRERLRRALAGRGLTLSAALSGALVAGEVSAEPTTLARSAVAYLATGAAPPAVRVLLGAGWAPLVGFAGLFLACVAVGWAGVSSATDAPTAPPPRPAAARQANPSPPSAEIVTRLGSAALRHPGTLTHLRFSADNRELVSYGYGRTRRWDARTGNSLGQPGPDLPIMTGYTKPTADGTAVITVHLESPPFRQLVRRVEIATGRHTELFSFPDQKSKAGKRFASLYVASPDGVLLAQHEHDERQVTLWDLKTGKSRWTAEPPVRDHVLLFTPDSKHLMTAGGSGRMVRFWDVQTGKEVHTFTRTGGRIPQSKVNRVAISADGRWVVAVDNSTLHGYGVELTVWDTRQPERPRVLVLDVGFALHAALAFGPDGALYTVGTAGAGGRTAVTKWDPASGERLARWAGPHGGHSGDLTAAVSPNGLVLAVGTDEGVIRLYESGTGKEIAATDSHAAAVTGIGFDPTGREVRTAAADGSVTVWDGRTGVARARRGPPPPAIDRPGEDGGEVRSPDGRWVVTSRLHPRRPGRPVPPWEATLWDAASGQKRHTFGAAGWAIELLPVPNGKLLLCRHDSQGGHQVQVWETETGTVLPHITRVFDGNQTLYAVTADGKTLVTCEKEQVTGFELATGKERFAWKLADHGVLDPPPKGDPAARAAAIAAAPDGKTLAISVAGGFYSDPKKRTHNLVLVELETGKVLRREPTPETVAGRLVFSPDGKRVVGPFCVWDAATLKELRRFPSGLGVTAATFSPDGRRVVTGHANGTAVIWAVDSD